MVDKNDMDIQDAKFEKVNEEETQEEVQEEVMEDSTDEIEKIRKENEELTNSFMRLQADFANYKKRTEKEKLGYISLGVRKLAEDLLPAIDNLDRAMDSIEDHGVDKEFQKGIKLIQDQLIEILNKNKINEIVAEGKPFDPNLHHAVAMVEDNELEPDTVVDVLQKGYLIDETVMRPSMVRVSTSTVTKGEDKDE